MRERGFSLSIFRQPKERKRGTQLKEIYWERESIGIPSGHYIAATFNKKYAVEVGNQSSQDVAVECM